MINNDYQHYIAGYAPQQTTPAVATQLRLHLAALTFLSIIEQMASLKQQPAAKFKKELKAVATAINDQVQVANR